MLVDVFVNSIYLFDDKMVITFNYKDSVKTITFDDVKQALSKRTYGSSLNCLGAPKTTLTCQRGFVVSRLPIVRGCQSADKSTAQKASVLRRWG